MRRQALLLIPLLFVAPRGALPAETDPSALVTHLKVAWESRDPQAYLSLWSFKTPEQAASELIFAQRLMAWQEAHLLVERLGSIPKENDRYRAIVRSFTVTEPRGREEEWSLTLEKGEAGWAIVDRESLGIVDGLEHLSVDPKGYRAAGLTLTLEDFELRMSEGTLYTSGGTLGPTLLIFVGKGVVKVSPRPPTEKEVLRRFCGSPEMVEPVSVAFIRIHPADFHKVLTPSEPEPDPHAADRLGAARQLYQTEVTQSFVLDGDLPGSPWWVLPSVGDALVTFRTAKRGTLTFTVFESEPEGISLFDREKRRQICLYPAGGRGIHYSEDEGRAADVLSHDIRARFDPVHEMMEAEDTVKMRILIASHTLRLRLADGLQVRSITSQEGGEHVFFRIRAQESLMVSLGALSGTVGEITLKVRYGGPARTGPIDPEAQVVRERSALDSEAEPMPLEQVLVLTSRTAWYPHVTAEDYSLATLRLDVPVSCRAVAGGTLVSTRSEGGRRVMEFRQDRPGKYLAVVVGRLEEGGEKVASGVSLRAFAVPRSRHDAPEVLESTAEILQFYSKEFGPCPYANLNIVMIESENGGGHSPPGMVILARRPFFLKGALKDDPGNFSDISTFFLAHELAHQWWGHGVAGENYHERWLSEGLAQYAAALWVREKYGEGPFQGVLRRLTRWALKLNDEGPISLGHRLAQVSGNPQAFRAVVYDKGAYVLLMLRAMVGEEPLKRALVSLQERHRFEKIGTADFERALEEQTGRDLSGYLQEWVFETKLPAVSVSRKTERVHDSYRTIITIQGTDVPGPLPLEVSLITEGGTEKDRLMLSDHAASWTLETKSAPKKVEVNEDHAMLVRVRGSESS
jgi:hypothetical protein